MRLLESIQSTMATYRLLVVLVDEGEAVGRLDEFEADDLREELAGRLSALSAEYATYAALPGFDASVCLHCGGLALDCHDGDCTIGQAQALDPNSVTVISY